MSPKFPSKRAQEVASYFLEYDSQRRYDNNSRIRDHIRFFFICYYYSSFVIGECCCRIVFIVAIFTALYVFNRVKKVSSISSFSILPSRAFLLLFSYERIFCFSVLFYQSSILIDFYPFFGLQRVYNYVSITLESIVCTA